MTTIEVTQADIDAGVPTSYCWCPIALAIMRVAQVIAVHTRTATVTTPVGTWGRLTRPIPLPESAQRFIADLDAGRPVAPFTFEVHL